MYNVLDIFELPERVAVNGFVSAEYGIYNGEYVKSGIFVEKSERFESGPFYKHIKSKGKYGPVIRYDAGLDRWIIDDRLKSDGEGVAQTSLFSMETYPSPACDNWEHRSTPGSSVTTCVVEDLTVTIMITIIYFASS